MRRFLDVIYEGSGWLAALMLLAIAVLVLGQIIGRIFGAGALPAHHIAGLFLAASLFLALAYTLASGEHIRVSIVIEHVGPRARWWMELWCLTVGAFLAGYFAYFTGQLAWESWLFGERSDGLVGVPYWIPESAMALGIGVFFIRLIDELVQLFRTGTSRRFQNKVSSFGDATQGGVTDVTQEDREE